MALSGGEDTVDAELCIGTNDPDETTLIVPIGSTSSGSSVLIGEPAPDFNLNDLEGKPYVLSEQLGHPIVLCYFATW